MQRIEGVEHTVQRGLIRQSALQRRFIQGDVDYSHAAQPVLPAFGYHPLDSDPVVSRCIQVVHLINEMVVY